MKTKKTTCHSIGRVACAGALLLIASSASAQNMFVGTYGGHSVVEYPTSGTPSLFASGLAYPSALAFNGAGDLFAVDQTGGEIYEYSPGGGATPTTFATGLDLPYGMAFDSTGDLYVVSSIASSGGYVTEITPGGNQSVFASGLDAPTDLAFNNAGTLFVVDSGSGNANGNITEISQGGTVNIFPNPITKPLSIAFQGVALPVPEPSVLGLFGVGSAMLIAFYNKRKK